VTSTFNWLGQYASSPGTGPLLCKLVVSSLGVARLQPVLIAPTHRRMARLSRSGLLWLNTKIYPWTVTHPSTNRAQRRATMLIKTNALPLSQAATAGSQWATWAWPKMDAFEFWAWYLRLVQLPGWHGYCFSEYVSRLFAVHRCCVHVPIEIHVSGTKFMPNFVAIS